MPIAIVFGMVRLDSKTFIPLLAAPSRKLQDCQNLQACRQFISGVLRPVIIRAMHLKQPI